MTGFLAVLLAWYNGLIPTDQLVILFIITIVPTLFVIIFMTLSENAWKRTNKKGLY